MTLESHYASYQKLYSLPKYKEIDAEFEIGRIELKNEVFDVKDVARAILNKIGFIISSIEPAVHPSSPTYHSMVESSNITEEERIVLSKTLHTCSRVYHKGLLIEISDVKFAADYINSVWKEWDQIRSATRKCFSIIADAWNEDKPNKMEEIFSI